MNRSTHLQAGAINLNRSLARIVAVPEAGGSGEPPLPVHRDRL
ncbi:MAG TPA: hypothetical protein VJ278_04890 [Chthoniobacterales bacterium]|nr:hypothetical protein [Chthoniobacterales bacterium]